MPAAERYEVVVIGLGVMGLAATYSLAKRGVKVLGLEQETLFHTKGSSHGESRAIRMAYFEHEDYIPLLKSAYQLWTHLELKSSVEIFKKCGLGFFADPQSSSVFSGICSAAAKFGIPVERYSNAEAAKKFSQFKAPSKLELLYEPNAGMLHVDAALKSFAQHAEKNGATLKQQEKLLHWKDGKTLEIKTDKGSYLCDKIIFAGGPWTAQLMSELKLPLKIFRALQYWFEAPTSAQNYPSFGFHLENADKKTGDFYYGFPSLDGKSLKVGSHFALDPLQKPEDKEIATAPPRQLRDIQEFVHSYLPELGNFLRFTSCIYTMTPDENFIVDMHPHSKNVAFACGFSGHGFKFAPLIGEVLADLATMGQSSHPTQFLGLSRFTP